MSASMQLQREVRFGAVLYGGVSLCVYMNGIAQELLHLVKSTAPSRDDPHQPFVANPTGTQAVYRRLGQFLAHPDRPADFSRISPDTPIHTRFLIDAIAGTSAGGINGVFLAKALALEGDLTSLKDLWKDEGDISKLINDKGSMVDDLSRYELQQPPTSLLNSQRMYVELLKALRGMDTGPSPDADRPSALVDELDLHITATDLRGLVLPIQLTDGQIFERRHKTTFHFRHSPLTDTYHFKESCTPFLAFAARCTSSFPVAFEPMQFADIDDALRREGILMRDAAAASSNARYHAFYPDYTPDALRNTGVPQLEFEHRAFADGGYLDNKPFSFVIDEILKRQGTLPVDRKLFYLEPAPDTPEHDKIRIRRPDAIANAWMALSSLPRYETIRGDLERALERNREIDRLRNLIQSIEAAARDIDDIPVNLAAGEWEKLDTRDLGHKFGRSYIAYHRIKVTTVTNDLTTLLCDYFQVHQDSLYGDKLRFLVAAWRDEAFGPDASSGKEDQLNKFLLYFDIGYRLRRLHHLFRLLDAAPREAREKAAAIRAALHKPYNRLQKLRRKPALNALGGLGTLEDLRNAIGMAAEPAAAAPDPGLKLDYAASFDAEAASAHGVLRKPGIREAIDKTTGQLSALYYTAFTETRKEVDAALHCDADDESAGAQLCRKLDAESKNFERHDVLTFPLVYNTALGEMDLIEIFRISPNDAPIGARHASAQKPKVKGAALGAFAGFLEREWRENDILWGRLDGAERIITALLPEDYNKRNREDLIAEAHLAIVEEELAGHPKLKHLNLKGMALLEAWMEQRMEMQQRKPWASTLARGTTVIGDILESIARRDRSEPTPLSAVPHVGRLIWGLVEVATPRSFPELIFRYWLSVIFALGVLLIAIGILVPAVQVSGWALVGIAATCKIATALLQDYFQEDPKQRHRPTQVQLAALAVAAAIPLALFFAAVGIGYATEAPLPDWTTRFLYALTGLATLLTIVFMIRVALVSKGLAIGSIERWRTVDDVQRDAGDIHDPRRSAIRRHLKADAHFLAAYSLLFGALGLTMLRTNDPLPGAIVLLFGFATALADYLENERINRNSCGALRELGRVGLKPPHPLDLPVASFSTSKWIFFYATLPAAAYWLFRYNDTWPGPFEWSIYYLRTVAAIVAVHVLPTAAVVGFLGVLLRAPALHKLSLLLLLIALPAMGFYFIARAIYF